MTDRLSAAGIGSTSRRSSWSGSSRNTSARRTVTSVRPSSLIAIALTCSGQTTPVNGRSIRYRRSTRRIQRFISSTFLPWSPDLTDACPRTGVDAADALDDPLSQLPLRLERPGRATRFRHHRIKAGQHLGHVIHHRLVLTNGVERQPHVVEEAGSGIRVLPDFVDEDAPAFDVRDLFIGVRQREGETLQLCPSFGDLGAAAAERGQVLLAPRGDGVDGFELLPDGVDDPLAFMERLEFRVDAGRKAVECGVTRVNRCDRVFNRAELRPVGVDLLPASDQLLELLASLTRG